MKISLTQNFGQGHSGLIAALSGNAISISGSPALGINNLNAGTIIGAINGAANVTNSGLFALQTLSGIGGTIVGGSHVSSNIVGDYYQAANGTLLIGVNGISGSGTIAGNYSTLTVSGTASFDPNTNLVVDLSVGRPVLLGSTLAGV